MPVISRLPALIGMKQARENRVINVPTLSKETGIPKQTLYHWLSGDMKRFDGEIIEIFCKYFGCGIGDLLVIVDQQSDVNKGEK